MPQGVWVRLPSSVDKAHTMLYYKLITKMKTRLRQPHTIIIILAIIAILNAAYLTSVAYGGSSFCDINATLSCGSVFSFSWSWIAGIPFPVAALIVYPVLGFLAWKWRKYDKNSIRWWKYVRIISGLGMLFNLYFLYHEVVTGVYCPFCLICLAIIITILVMSRREVDVLQKYHTKHK